METHCNKSNNTLVCKENNNSLMMGEEATITFTEFLRQIEHCSLLFIFCFFPLARGLIGCQNHELYLVGCWVILCSYKYF